MKGFGLLPTLARSASTIAVATGLAIPGVAMAQTATGPSDTAASTLAAPQTAAGPQSDAASAGVGSEIVVTGIRASLERSIAIKRNTLGIVDAISAEDIGKFPDTNLAESLQRIPGVSIDRVNGEGAQVTVRGFGPSYNLVTLNGRTLASSYDQTVGGDESGDGSRGVTRSFDFSNIATEGVKTLEVYKTGRAAVPSGGIGATINVVTRSPLDSKDPGFNGSIGAKANWDTSADDCVHCGSKVTPDITGVLNWSNPDQTFGVSLFGNYSQRHFSTVAATSNDWNIRTLSDFLDPANGFVKSDGTTKINTMPSNPNELVSVPNDSRYHFSDDKYERFNTRGVVQWKPVDTLTLTADALYVQTKQKEIRSDESNWFNRPFDEVTFDNNPTVATTTYLHETIAGVKDEDFEQQARAQKNTLQDYGLNAKWDVTDRFTFSVDGHYGKSSVLPDNKNGTSSTLVGLGANVIAAHSVDYSGPIPVQDETIDDSQKGNNNGVLDVGDVGSSIGRTFTTSQRQTVKEIRADGGWDLGGGSRFDFGGLYRDTKTNEKLLATQQTLGNWSVDNPGDVEAMSPGTLKDFCLLCKFNSYDPHATGSNLIAFRGDPLTLYNDLSQGYLAQDTAAGTNAHQIAITNNENNTVREKIWAAYGQVTWKGQLAGMDANLVAGARYEHTEEQAISLEAVPTAITWVSDNDFTVKVSNTPTVLRNTGHYDNLLPAFDFSLNLKSNLIARFSASRTIARPNYDSLFASTAVSGPPRPTAIGGVPTATTGNTNLAPLISDNFDVSFEWYYKRDSYISVGFFDKRVHNFLGTGETTGPLFGLKDPTSGAPGTRSGDAKAALQGLGADISDVNLFTYAALIQRDGAAAAATEFNAHYNPATHTVDQAFVNDVLSAVDIDGNADDPDYQFSISKPINNRDAQIWGFELQGQHFFGNTGIGVAASFTYVHGDVGFDNGGDPNVDQFALTGLSNSANATLIYDKNGISARLSYNWRDKFLSSLNRDSYRNPVNTKAYGQLDANISYDITPRIGVSIEAINLTNESLRTYGRSVSNVWFAQELQRRFLFGARYKF
jgi:TonB-dependent receptor